MTLEIIFAIVQVVVTEIVAVFFKDNIIPKKAIPLVNLGIGIVVAIFAICFGLFDNPLTAILASLGLAFAVGGIYDTAKSVNKTFISKEEK